MSKVKQTTHGAVRGVKGKVARKVEGPIAKRTPLSVDTIRSLFGALFLFLSIRTSSTRSAPASGSTGRSTAERLTARRPREIIEPAFSYRDACGGPTRKETHGSRAFEAPDLHRRRARPPLRVGSAATPAGSRHARGAAGEAAGEQPLRHRRGRRDRACQRARFGTRAASTARYNDLDDPVMGMAGSRFGRNVPLERTHPEPPPRPARAEPARRQPRAADRATSSARRRR